MKRIQNKVVRRQDGSMSLYMTRQAGREFRYVLHLSPAEYGKGRDYVAVRIRAIRADMHRSISNQRG